MPRSSRIGAALAGSLLVFFEVHAVHTAEAAEGDLIFTEALRSKQTAASPVGGKVRLYGPLPVSDAIRRAGDSAHLYLDGVDFAGEAGDVSLFVVDASRPGRKRTIRYEDYVTGIGNMVGMMREPVSIAQTIQDAEGGGTSLRPLTHLKSMSHVMLAVVVRRGTFKFERIVISTEKRPEAGQAPPPHLSGEQVAWTRSPAHEDQGDGTTAAFTSPIFLSGALARAPGSVYLHLEDVRMGPGGEAEVYLVDRDYKRVDPKLLIGRIEPPAAGASGLQTAPYTTSLEIKDFDAGGIRRTARTALRGFAHFSVALRVKRGPVSVERFVLSTVSPAERQRALGREAGR